MVKINSKLLPIKAHYFFFMAAMGPILPQISVYGKQLGIPPDTMGYITSVLPILYVITKPIFGFLADYFANFRKLIFVSLITVMTLCYAGFYFVSENVHHWNELNQTYYLNLTGVQLMECSNSLTSQDTLCSTSTKLLCYSNGLEIELIAHKLQEVDRSIQLKEHFAGYHVCSPSQPSMQQQQSNLNCSVHLDSLPECMCNATTFWLFVILMCAGTIGFNVVNCISDAICFDVLGKSEEMKYGKQRVWGTIGFGLTALLAGIAVDFSTTDYIKSFTPALIIMLIFSGLDLISVTKVQLPAFATSESIFKDVWGLLSQSSIAIFLVFATIAGIIDSFIIYFMFWHLEEVAQATGYMGQIKLIEGCVVAAECLCGEILMFLYSGKILKRIGYVHCLTLCFFTYAIRLILISLIPNPWWLVPIELVMQGCTYALCYTCIVAYASAIAPEGTSATVQGLVAGMDDGLGFAIGSLIGGQAFKHWGGRRSFEVFACAALVTCVAHYLIRPTDKTNHQSYKEGGYELPMEQSAVGVK